MAFSCLSFAYTNNALIYGKFSKIIALSCFWEICGFPVTASKFQIYTREIRNMLSFQVTVQ